MDVLQRDAIRLGRRVNWHISNRNNEDLEELREEFRLNPSEELARKIKINEEEQKRWKAIYGENGKLGFGNNWTKTFNADESEEKYHSLENGVTMPPQDQDLYKREQKETVDRVLERMKKVANG